MQPIKDKCQEVGRVKTQSKKYGNRVSQKILDTDGKVRLVLTVNIAE